ncbi:hypothetical protein GCM10018780_58650 [Streptomyces lanatus]|nr:hypothetical protein GCM10018780_58650 [Streptomyces lanatus]
MGGGLSEGWALTALRPADDPALGAGDDVARAVGTEPADDTHRSHTSAIRPRPAADALTTPRSRSTASRTPPAPPT